MITYRWGFQRDLSARAAWRLASLGVDNVSRYVDGHADWLAAGLPTEGRNGEELRAGDVADGDAPTCRIGDRVSNLRKLLEHTGWRSCVVVNDERVVLGRLRASALEGKPTRAAESAMEPGPATVRPSEPLAALIERMQKQHVGTMIVTTPEGVLVGVLRREDGERRLAERAK